MKYFRQFIEAIGNPPNQSGKIKVWEISINEKTIARRIKQINFNQKLLKQIFDRFHERKKRTYVDGNGNIIQNIDENQMEVFGKAFFFNTSDTKPVEAKLNGSSLGTIYLSNISISDIENGRQEKTKQEPCWQINHFGLDKYNEYLRKRYPQDQIERELGINWSFDNLSQLLQKMKIKKLYVNRQGDIIDNPQEYNPIGYAFFTKLGDGSNQPYNSKLRSSQYNSTFYIKNL